MTASHIETLESQMVARLRQSVAYLASETSCRGVADAVTAMNFQGVVAPCVLLQFRSEQVIGASGPSGKPIIREFDTRFDAYVLASSFTGEGEGRLFQPPPSEAVYSVGAYQMLDDVYGALQGFVLTPEATLLYEGCGYQTTAFGRVVYVSRWRCQVRRVGEIGPSS